MTCNEFETLARELTRADFPDTREQKEARAHAKSCSRCAARLAEEKTLTAAIRAVAASEEAREMPSHMEASLRAAFRKQLSVPDPAFVAPSKNRLPVTARGYRLSGWLMAAASLIVAMLAFFALRVQNTGAPGLAARDNQVQVEQVVPKKSEGNTVPANVNAIGPSQKPLTPGRKMNTGHPMNLSAKAPKSKPPVEETTGSNREHSDQQEITTAFLPLTQGYDLPLTEGGQIMRVKLPRSALNSFGLPVNFSRANETIKADVLLGNDGIPRAIRFVQ